MTGINRKNLPRWLIVLIDLFIVAFSVIIAYLLRFNFDIPDFELKPLPVVLLIIFLIRLAGFLIGKTYAGLFRYTSTQDITRIFVTMISGSVLLGLINVVYYSIGYQKFPIPFSIIIIEFLCSLLAMSALRIIVKITYLEITNPSGHKSKVIIFGAGEAGVLTKRVLERDAGSRLKVDAFLDDDPAKSGKKIEGVEIFKTSNLEKRIREKNIEQVIISVIDLQADKKQKIIETCLKHDVRVLNIPPIVQWINGELSFNQIKNIHIEDLLEREVIRLEEETVKQDIAGQTVLITGASGSIGSELVRQVSVFSPQKIILLDQAETSLFHLELECRKNAKHDDFEFIIADICNQDRITEIFKTRKPNIVYHAAAYKHVPMMEINPPEAVYTNVFGTRIIADLSLEMEVEKFIMISTDKAVNPTSIMGASKRIAEIYTQSLNKLNKTKFITTRFGNVLGSNGSVVPLFRKQIEKGGPLTITHPEITRYFMTIPEACQLVLEAGAMGNGGEIYIFDMGESVKILDLAKKMIKLSGLELGRDIQIEYIGLRPGEKLYEELLNDQENTIPTHHPQIMIAKTREYKYDDVSGQINNLIESLDKYNDFETVRIMKKIVPEFISKNSIYEQLDNSANVE